jgi:hypothetical protein
MVPGSCDGLTSTRSGMTVGEMRESCAGKPHALRGRLCLVFANTSVNLSSPGRGSAAPRLLARSRTDDFADRKILCCHGGGVMREPSQDASHPSDREAGLPAHAEAFTRSGNCRERNKRKHGPLRFAPYLYFIGAPLSGPSGGDCTLPRSPDLDSGRTACPRQGSGRSPCKKKRKRPVEARTARPQAPGLCSTPGFLRGAVSGARKR